jgi:ferredoxin
MAADEARAGRYRIRVGCDGIEFECRESQPVLLAMCAAGRKDLPVGCRSGGCGVCRVRVLAGEYETGTMSAERVTPTQRARGEVLACQLLPRSDLDIEPAGGLADGGGRQSDYERFVARLKIIQEGEGS